MAQGIEMSHSLNVNNYYVLIKNKRKYFQKETEDNGENRATRSQLPLPAWDKHDMTLVLSARAPARTASR
jgi:hypothetical protein